MRLMWPWLMYHTVRNYFSSFRKARQPQYSDTPCWCDHTGAAHAHYRPGTDCSKCPCRRYKVGVR